MWVLFKTHLEINKYITGTGTYTVDYHSEYFLSEYLEGLIRGRRMDGYAEDDLIQTF